MGSSIAPKRPIHGTCPISSTEGFCAHSGSWRPEPAQRSDWRHDPAGLFSARYWGMPYADVVPDLPRRSRGDEIRAWLKKHSDVDRYAVIDDDDDQLDDLPAKPSRFLTQHY